ncbi:MAG: hypothetical protein ACRDL1_09320 [Solirubrobacterales bacterium]
MPDALLALSTGDVFLIAIIVTVPFALLSFLGARHALGQIGKGQFAIEQELPQRGGEGPAPVSREAREAEVRQMVEAKAYRQAARGEAPLDVDAEVKRLLEERPGPALGGDPGLREEVRQLVVARNERRMRKGEEPLDVDAEVERQLRELENLGQ